MHAAVDKQVCDEMKNKVHHSNQVTELALMSCGQKCTRSVLLTKNFG